MLKNISNNVKCVKVRYAKIQLSSASLFALSFWIVVKTMNMKMGTIQQPYSLLSTSFYIPNEWTQHSSDHTPVANKKVTVNTSSSSPNGSVLSYYIQAIFALEVKVGMRKTIPQEQTGSY